MKNVTGILSTYKKTIELLNKRKVQIGKEKEVLIKGIEASNRVLKEAEVEERQAEVASKYIGNLFEEMEKVS